MEELIRTPDTSPNAENTDIYHTLETSQATTAIIGFSQHNFSALFKLLAAVEVGKQNLPVRLEIL